jgi:glucosylceramidase
VKRTTSIIQTSKDTSDRLTAKGEVCFTPGPSGLPVVLRLNTGKEYQSVIGFGGAFTEAAAYTLSRIPPEERARVIRSYYHPEEGIGYTMGRTPINSCDFSLGNYTYVEEGDKELRTFSIEREHRYVIPMLHDAARELGKELTVFASPWSPPAWMKTNGEMNNGGSLKDEYKETWARYYALYIRAMGEAGIPICGITVQNEPEATQVWDSCRYTAEEERDFVKHYLGPVLLREGLKDIAIVVWDHNRDLLVERARAILSDPEAARYVWGTGIHWYVSEDFGSLSTVHEEFPDKHLLFTEGCIEGGVRPGSWETGERYGRNIMGDLNNWLEGWLDWNLVLDEEGGPNHVGNYCDAPVIADTRTGEVRFNSSYYYIGHFSKFIRPGAVRIQHTLAAEELSAVAFRNSEGSLAVVVMNTGEEETDFAIELEGAHSVLPAPPHSISTYVIR